LYFYYSFIKSVQRLTNPLDIEFIMTNIMQTAVYRIQNTKYRSHKKSGPHEPGKQVYTKMTKL
jgi:hypothetical protein